MISLSQWGLFNAPAPMLMISGYKLAEGDLAKLKAEWQKPGAIVQLIPLDRGELQPIYRWSDYNQAYVDDWRGA